MWSAKTDQTPGADTFGWLLPCLNSSIFFQRGQLESKCGGNFSFLGLKQASLIGTMHTYEPPVCPAKTQISLGIRPVWSESSLCAHWVAKDPSFLHVDSED